DLNPRLPVLETGALAGLSYRPAFCSRGKPHLLRQLVPPTCDVSGWIRLGRRSSLPCIWASRENRGFARSPVASSYRVSLCAVCLRHEGQNFRNSTRSGWSRLFLVVM